MIYKDKEPEVTLNIGEDYPLTGTITNFESYMFATKDKFISEHTSFNEEIVIVDGNRSTECVSMNELSDRKKALSKFNALAKEQELDISSKHYSCIMIDFVIEDDAFNEKAFNKSYKQLKKYFINWTTENNRVAVMVQHFYQGERWPHVHILLQRKPRKHNEFQDFLIKEIG